jgi:hypothetical protein
MHMRGSGGRLERWRRGTCGGDRMRRSSRVLVSQRVDSYVVLLPLYLFPLPPSLTSSHLPSNSATAQRTPRSAYTYAFLSQNAAFARRLSRQKSSSSVLNPKSSSRRRCSSRHCRVRCRRRWRSGMESSLSSVFSTSPGTSVSLLSQPQLLPTDSPCLPQSLTPR